MDRYRSWVLFISLLFLVLHSSCRHEPAQVKRGFYFWRTSGAEDNECAFLKQQDIQKLYERLLDVDWSEVNGAVPVAQSRLQWMNYRLKRYDSLQMEFVPVVFITNKTFERIDSSDIGLLAKRLVRRCLPAYDSIDINYEKSNYIYHNDISPKEIQFDCDWTVKTAPRYFAFLKAVKHLLPDSIQMSATIRLHQYKYFSKTGVPPVDRGMLMMYNISDPKKYTPVNSIFDLKQAKAYFSSNKKYPLPLDIALPSWSWCLIFRNQEFYQIENGLTEEELKQLSFLKPKGDHFYRVIQDTVYRDLFLRPGDEIKAESIDEKLLHEAAKLAQSAVNTNDFTVSFFELSYNDIKQYSDGTFQKLYNSFR